MSTQTISHTVVAEGVGAAPRRRAWIGLVAAVALLLIGKYLSLRADASTEGVSSPLIRDAATVSVVVLAIIVTVAVISAFRRIGARRLTGSEVNAIELVGGLVLAIALTGVGAEVLEIPTRRLLLGGALTGAALTLGAQTLLSNVIAGMVIVCTRPFRVGTHLRITGGLLGGTYFGTVAKIGLLHILLRHEGRTYRLPTAAVLTGASVAETRSGNVSRVEVSLPHQIGPADLEAAVEGATRSLVARVRVHLGRITDTGWEGDVELMVMTEEGVREADERTLAAVADLLQGVRGRTAPVTAMAS